MKILTIDEVEELLKVKKSTLYSWVSEGRIPSFKLHGLVRFDKEEIEGWVRQSRIMKRESKVGKRKRNGAQDIDFLIKRAIQSEK